MFTARQVLEEFVSVAGLADSLTIEAVQWRMTLRYRERKRLDQERWRKKPGSKLKISLWMKAYYQRPGVKEANRERMRARWADPVKRKLVQEAKKRWEQKQKRWLSRKQSMELTCAVSSSVPLMPER